MAPEQSHEVEPPADDLGRLVVLLVDDQMMVAEGIRRMLASEEDIEFHYCAEPKKAVAMALEIRPTVILQDLIMPDMDGYTLVNDYRAEPGTQNIPVIVLSTKEDPKDKSKAFERGANDYLVKLPDRIELVARIRAHSRSYLAHQALRETQAKLEQSNAELKKLSCLDGLTGIANRRRLDEFLRTECLRSVRDDTPLSLILIDIDFFKPYNDHYGHIAGDECLRQVARSLDEAVQRASDLIARYGGEEFAAILPNTDLSGARRIAHELCEKIRSLEIPHEYSQVADIVTISLGVVSRVACENLSPSDLINLADAALYEAKETGRNRYVVAEEAD
ncbi:MAG: diguanylate cyclase [Gammaproteobacteria bacterium]|nr:diguanylate cyclase [Gammaproteobacteria bacterium]